MREAEVKRLQEIAIDPTLRVVFDASERAVAAEMPRIEQHFTSQTPEDLQQMQQQGATHDAAVQGLNSWVQTVKKHK